MSSGNNIDPESSISLLSVITLETLPVISKKGSQETNELNAEKENNEELEASESPNENMPKNNHEKTSNTFLEDFANFPLPKSSFSLISPEAFLNDGIYSSSSQIFKEDDKPIKEHTLKSSKLRNLSSKILSIKRQRSLPVHNVSLAPPEHMLPSTSSYSSSSPKAVNISYSPSLYSVNYKKTFKRQKIIEELVDTENSYIEFLKLLKETFNNILDCEKISQFADIPLSEYADALITEHKKFLSLVQLHQNNSGKSFLSFYSPSTSSAQFPSQKKVVNDKPPLFYYSSYTASYIANLVAEKAINLYIYREYFLLFSLVSRLLEKLDAKGSVMRKGYEKFLEAVQPLQDKSDLSFLSLLQRPAARIGKYKLLIESLILSMPENDKYTKEMKQSLNKIRYKLNEVNTFSNCARQNDICSTLFSKIVFKQRLAYPVECLGLPLLCGPLGCVWRTSSKSLHHQFCGLLLFKSTLLVCSIDKHNKYTVHFMIPLKCAKIENNDVTEGLYCMHLDSFKIVFEYHYALYEILLLSFRKNEINVWRNKLETLISVVNGPYRFDYSASGDPSEGVSVRVPQSISPLDVSLNRFNEIDYNFACCYFGELIPLKIKFEEEKEDAGQKIENDSMSTVSFLKDAPELVFKESFLRAIENDMEHILSIELLDSKKDIIEASININKVRQRSFQHLRLGTIRFSASLRKSSTSNYTPSSGSEPYTSTPSSTSTTGKDLIRRASNALGLFIKRNNKAQKQF